VSRHAAARFAIAGALATLALVAGCSVPPAAPPPAPPAPAAPAAAVAVVRPEAPKHVTVRVVAFNDFHGQLDGSGLTLPWPDAARPGQSLRLPAGGAAALAGLVAALRAGEPQSVVVSSGDMVGAAPLVSALFRHESTIDVMNRLGVDLAVPGNHEFDAGRDELLRLLRGGCAGPAARGVEVSCALGRHEGAQFATIAANVTAADGRPLFPPSQVREFGGVRVGFIGAVTRSTPYIVVPSGVAGLRFGDEAEAINREAARLKALGVAALVAVIHEGGETGTPGQPLAWNEGACTNPRGPVFSIERRLVQDVDLVLSAHTHQGYACVVGGRAVMQATALGRGVSVADLVIDTATGEVDRARSRHRNLPVIDARVDPALREAVIAAEPAPWAAVLRAAKPDGAIAARVAAYAATAAPIAQRPVGRIAGSFERSGRTDGSAGRLVADAQWQATRAPERGGSRFALMNPGGIRADLACRGTPPCPVSYGDAFAMQPFGNSLVVLTLRGDEIRRLLENQQRPGRTQSPRGI
jgi:5'-nucleotidase